MSDGMISFLFSPSHILQSNEKTCQIGRGFILYKKTNWWKCNYSVNCLIDVFLNSAKCDSNIIQNNLSGCSADSHTKGDQNQLYIKHKTWGFGRRLVIMSCQHNSPDESLVPAFDDLARPQREGEGIAAGDARVKLAPVFLQGPLQESQVNVSCFYGENVNYCRCFATTSWSESGNQI